ncbi:MAG: ThuA domain-containing protein [Planctomycetota bacterium]
MKLLPGLLLASTMFLSPSLWADDDRLILSPPDGKANGKHVVLISGDEEYRSEESCPMLAKILSQHHGFRCTVLFALDRQTGAINPYQIDNIPGTGAIDSADLVILATRWRTLPDDQLRPILDFLRAGKPLIAYRTATHAFKSGHYGDYDWANFGINVVGENWHSHHGRHKVEGGRGIIEPQHADHPILNSVKSFYTPSDIYGVVHLDQDAATVLVRGQILEHLDPAAAPVSDGRNDPMMPLAWLKSYAVAGGTSGRVFATTAGAAVDFRDESLRRLVVNAVFFLTDVSVPDRADVSLVDDYRPSFFGFIKGQDYIDRDMRVDDFALGNSASIADPTP